MKKYFYEINFGEIDNKYILLDVDGTIASDCNENLEGRILDGIKRLKVNNEVVLLSNNRNRGRIERISKATGLKYLKTQYKKPNKKILKDIQGGRRKKILVIGDKLLTDVIFAKRTKAPYIKVRRLTSPNDRWFVKAFYIFDDMLFLVVRIFF